MSFPYPSWVRLEFCFKFHCKASDRGAIDFLNKQTLSFLRVSLVVNHLRNIDVGRIHLPFSAASIGIRARICRTRWRITKQEMKTLLAETME